LPPKACLASLHQCKHVTPSEKRTIPGTSPNRLELTPSDQRPNPAGRLQPEQPRHLDRIDRILVDHDPSPLPVTDVQIGQQLLNDPVRLRRLRDAVEGSEQSQHDLRVNGRPS